MDRRAFLAALATTTAGCSNLPLNDDTPTPEADVVVRYDTPSPTPEPVVDVGKITTEVGYTEGLTGGLYLEVKIRATVERTGITVLLADEDGTTVDEASLSKTALLDGSDAVQLDIPEDAAGKSYTVQIIKGDSFGGNPTLVTKQSVDIGGVHAKIRDISVTAEEMQYSDGYSMTYAGATLENTGELPFEITDVEIETSEGSGTLIGMRTYVLESGESQRFESDSAFSLPTLTSGVNEVLVTVRDGDSVVARNEKRVTV